MLYTYSINFKKIGDGGWNAWCTFIWNDSVLIKATHGKMITEMKHVFSLEKREVLSNEKHTGIIPSESFHIRVQQAFHPPSPIILKFISYVYNTKTRKTVEF